MKKGTLKKMLTMYNENVECFGVTLRFYEFFLINFMYHSESIARYFGVKNKFQIINDGDEKQIVYR